ncbi:MAG: PD-(D/E)XK nuclease family protein, partial [Terrimesophilobacter sp.]
PLGHRRGDVERAAERVRAATPKAAGRWQEDVELLLAERERALYAGEFGELPTRIPASRFKDYVTDPASVAADLRRPMPEKPYRASRLGTLFHAWVEERAGVVGSAETIDSLSVESDIDDGAPSRIEPGQHEVDPPELEVAELARLQAVFEKSEWAGLKPVDVERELHLPFDGCVVICRIDAIYERNGRYQIVDWKTGKAPKSDDELADRQLQLALYRLAFARWKGLDPTTVDAVFYYVSDDRVIAPTHIDDEAELLKRWRESTSSD